MKIFYILDHNLSKQVAGTFHVKEVTENLHLLGCKVTLFIPEYGAGNYETSVSKVVIPTTQVRLLRVFIFYTLVVPYLLFHTIKEKPDIFYIREMYISFTVQILAKLIGIPLVIECNGVPSEEVKDLGGSYWAYKLSRKFQEINIRMADKVITVTGQLKKLLSTRYHISPEKIIVVRNGANTDLFKPTSKSIARRELKLDESFRYACFVSSFYPYHGVSELIHSAKIALTKNPKIKFLMIGDGNDKSQCEKLVQELGIAENFIFTGSVSHERVPFYISASDFAICFIRSSQKDDLYSPLKLYEYLACGVPVLASEGIECGQFVESVQAGISVELNNFEEIAEGILKILDKDLAESFSKNGRNYIEKNGSWKSIAETVLSECKELV